MVSPLIALALFPAPVGGAPQVVSPISLDARDFSDLAPLRKAIGSARVVQLGELTHGDGTSFLLKSRIIRFLHEQAGFDVLVWESGFLECSLLDDKLKEDIPISDAASTAIFPHWSRAKESLGVFEYARRTQRTSRPLRMAGYDIQASGRSAYLPFLAIAAKISKLAGPNEFLEKLEQARNLADGPVKDEAILRLAIPLKLLLDSNRTKLVRSMGHMALDELSRQVYSMADYYLMMESYRRFQRTQSGLEFQVGYNLRERANAANMLWLANTKFRGKKLIVWAHNSHVSNNGSDGDYRRPSRGEVSLDSTGRHLKAALSEDLYSIGFVASGGQWSWLGQPPVDFEPAPEDSLEAILSRSGMKYGFLDLKRKGVLSRPLPGYMNRQNGQLRTLDWPKTFDGLIYIREMKPRTQLDTANAPNRSR